MATYYRIEITRAGTRFVRYEMAFSMQDVHRIADYWLARGYRVDPVAISSKSDDEYLGRRGK